MADTSAWNGRFRMWSARDCSGALPIRASSSACTLRTFPDDLTACPMRSMSVSSVTRSLPVEEPMNILKPTTWGAMASSLAPGTQPANSPIIGPRLMGDGLLLLHQVPQADGWGHRVGHVQNASHPAERGGQGTGGEVLLTGESGVPEVDVRVDGRRKDHPVLVIELLLALQVLTQGDDLTALDPYAPVRQASLYERAAFNDKLHE